MNINDGSIPAQSRLLHLFTPTQATPTTSAHFSTAFPGKPMVAESFDTTEPAQSVERHNQANAPAGGVQTDDFISGTATVQLASVAAPANYPLVGDHFSEKLTGSDGTAVVFYITEVGAPESIGALKTCRISFMQRVDSVSLPTS